MPIRFLETEPVKESDSSNPSVPSSTSLPLIVSDIDHYVPNVPRDSSDKLSADFYLPIALRKSKRSYTKYPLSNHVFMINCRQIMVFLFFCV